MYNVFYQGEIIDTIQTEEELSTLCILEGYDPEDIRIERVTTK